MAMGRYFLYGVRGQQVREKKPDGQPTKIDIDGQADREHAWEKMGENRERGEKEGRRKAECGGVRRAIL